MRSWFVFNTIDSRDMGLYVSQMPEIVRPAERIEYKQIPGRPGSLSYREGENVFDGYKRSVTVYHQREQPLEAVLEWLRGEGDVIFSNETNRAYIADLTAEIRFSPVDNDWEQATVEFFCQPYKKQYPPELPISVTDTATINNPGNIPSKPLIVLPMLTGTEGTLTIGENTYIFTHNILTGMITVDCDAEIVTGPQGLRMDDMDISNGFPRLEPGDNAVTVSGFSDAVVITPRWRWI